MNSNYNENLIPICNTISSADTKRKETLILKSKEKYKNLIEGYDYLICKECGFYAAELTSHITTHSLTSYEYKNRYDIKYVKCQRLIDSICGENNPGFQHNGKYSAFSNNFIYSDTTDREEIKRKAAKNRADNNGNTTTIEYWLKKTSGDMEKAKALLKERQTTFSLEKCITKFGEEKGFELFLKRQEKWLNTLSNKSKEEIDAVNKKKSNQLCFHTLWKNASHLEGELYLIKLPNNFYKIGITTKTVFDRYKKQSLDDCDILIQYNSNINHCFQIEQLVKKQFKSNTILKEEKYKDFGWTETFKDINESDLVKVINNLIKNKEHTKELFKQNFKLNYSENF